MRSMKQSDEITGSDSRASISILKREGSSRRTKRVELKAFFSHAYRQLNHVKIL